MNNETRSALEKLKAHFAKGENLRLKRTAAQRHLRTIGEALTDRPTHADARSEEGPYKHLSDDAVGRGIQHQYNEGDAIGSVTELALEAARRLREDEGGESDE